MVTLGIRSGPPTYLCLQHQAQHTAAVHIDQAPALLWPRTLLTSFLFVQRPSMSSLCRPQGSQSLLVRPSPSPPLIWAPLPTLGGSGVSACPPASLPHLHFLLWRDFWQWIPPARLTFLRRAMKTVPVATCLKAFGVRPARVCCGDKAFRGISISASLSVFSVWHPQHLICADKFILDCTAALTWPHVGFGYIINLLFKG